jgi:PAS domain S-box-containing protein
MFLYSFGAFSILSLFMSEIYFLTGTYILLRNPKSSVNRLYFLVSIAIGIWGLGEGMERASTDPATALFWAGYVIGIGSAFEAVFLLHFWLAFSGQASRFKRIPIYVLYIPAAVFVAMRLLYPGLLIKGVQLEYWGYSTEGTTLYLVFMLYVVAYSAIMAYLALRASRRVTGMLKKHARNVGLGVLFVVILGVVTQLSRPLLHLPIPELTVIGAIVFTSIITYTINKYGMLVISAKMVAENIIGTMEDYVIGIDKDKKIVIVNNSVLNNLGYKQEELLKKPISEILSTDIFSLSYDQFLNHFPLANYQAELMSKDGSSFPISVNASVVKDEQDDVSGFVFVLRDMRKINELIKTLREKTSELSEKVTDSEKNRSAILNMMEDSEEVNKQLVKTQEDLKNAMNELQKTDVKKDEFISITAHEFKTPLTAIHGFAELLQDKKIDVKSTKKYLTIIKEETERLSKLVTEILNLSRIDLGTLKLTYEDIDLYSMVETIRSEADIKIKSRGLKSGYELEKRLPKIESDREKLTEILLNLLDNAAKYTNQGTITLKIFREKDSMHFMVKDTGIGIPEEAQKKIFERFYQVDSSNTRKVGGTGLGLALSREYVVTMGGKMWFVSEAGKGTEFHFTLPMKAPKKDEAKEKYEGKTDLFKR